MRLSTEASRDWERGVAVIQAALDGGVRLLDTADVYCRDDGEIGHNERLIADALRRWSGDRSTVCVATKGGLTRPDGRWVPNGRAKHLRAACDASLRALDVDTIDLYQLHTVDPRTSFATSVRALAALHDEGLVRRIGLCNVTVGQIEVARDLAAVSAVQVSLSVLDEDNLRNGVAEYCREHGIDLLAYRPLGGDRRRRLKRDPVLTEIGAAYDATPYEVALAWLMDLDRVVVPLAGATRVETARSLGRALQLTLTDADRKRLDTRFPAGHLLRVPRSVRRPPDVAEGEVVIVMGCPAAGKSTLAERFVAAGYARLNRDTRAALEDGGARLADLLPDLEAGLASGIRRWVLDNTYPSRKSRNPVVECAWRHGVPVRCVWLATSLEEAQINAVTRLLSAHGSLPTPEEITHRAKQDPRFLGPNALFRYERELEPPVADEGFAVIEERRFQRADPSEPGRRAMLVEVDGVLAASAAGHPALLHPDDAVVPNGRAEALARWHQGGWVLLGIAWRPQIQQEQTTPSAVRDCLDRIRRLLGVPIDFGVCPHGAGPPRCWCRKPLPGLALDLARRHGVDLRQSIMIGRSPADRTLARRLGMTYCGHDEFFADPGRVDQLM